MSQTHSIPFNKPYTVGKELYYIAEAVINGHLSGDGEFTKRCQSWIESRYNAPMVRITHSCTAALEMCADLLEVGPEDEIIMPSFTFVSTANAFARKGAKLRFVDIEPYTLNIDFEEVKKSVTPKTKAIVVVHYAGVACDMNAICEFAKENGIYVVEDAAQGVNARYFDRYLGTIGDLGCYSFHETKNFISGEGGALLVNNPKFEERAEYIREKGTNRTKFFKGEVDKYTWVDIGSSYLPSDMVSAFLWAQLENAETIMNRRCAIWRQYYRALLKYEVEGRIDLPHIPEHCVHNGHIFYLILKDNEDRGALIQHLKSKQIQAVFHYIPLHNAPMAKKLGLPDVQLPTTEDISTRILRLPSFFELKDEEVAYVIESIENYLVSGR